MVLVASALHAQALPTRFATRDWIIDRWSTDQGLPQNTVLDIAQGTDGYLWLATYGGLVRFDGVRFTAFTTRDYPELGSDRVMRVRLARDGGLWIGTDRGLVRYRDGRFQEWTDAEGRPPGPTSGLFVDSTGAVWLSTELGGVSRFSHGIFERFHGNNADAGWASAVVMDGRGDAWVSQRGGILIKRPNSDQFERIDLHLGDNRVHGPIHVDRAGDVWFDADRDAVRLTPSGLRSAGIPTQNVADDGSGGLWAWTRDGIWHRAQSGIVSFAEGPFGGNFGAVHALFVDREGTLWLGTDTGGLLRLRQRVFKMFTVADGLARDPIAAIMRDRHGTLWVGSSCGPTTLIPGGGLPKTTRTLANPGCAFSFAEGADGSVWSGAYGGLVRVAPDGSQARIPDDSLPHNTVLALYADPDTSMWIGTLNGLVHYVRGHYRVYNKSDGLPSNEIHYVTRDRHGALWVGTVGGLARLDSARFRSWTTREGLPHNFVRAIYQDADGVWWIGTYGGGLARFDGKRFTAIGSRDGLFDDIVSAILEDDQGNLWMSGNRGIFRASRAALNAFAAGTAPQVASVGYGPSDGLMTSETNGGFEPSAWQDKNGRLWFATVSGLATIDPHDAVPRTDAPGVTIEAVNVDGKALATTGTITLPVGARYLQVDYTGLTSVAPEQLVFRYRLDGLDSAWQYVNGRRTAYYSQLPPGHYGFVVSAASRDGAWNADGQRITIVIPAPWYSTRWFRLLMIVAVVGLVFALVRRRIGRLHEQQRVQREYTRQLLSGQEAERRRLAGELHDSLGQDLLVMKNRAAMALGSAELPSALRSHLEEISQVASQAVQNTRDISHGLRPYQLDRLGLAAALRDLADHAGGAAGLDLHVEVDGVDDRFSADAATLVYRIAQEALTNILKHAAAKHASIVLQPQPDAVCLVISDDGRGTDLSAGPGFGLTGIRQRVHILAGTIQVKSAPGQGTILEITIPAAGV
ncbi:MAG TPA: two-component regulator propeller domain-containing protein [Gemmatimonadaceae bacterium]